MDFGEFSLFGFGIWLLVGWKDGKRYRMREVRENCMSMCMVVVNIGNGKLSLLGENIYLLYYKIG